MEETSEEENGEEAEVPGGFARNLEWTKFLDALRGKSSLSPAVPTKVSEHYQLKKYNILLRDIWLSTLSIIVFTKLLHPC